MVSGRLQLRIWHSIEIRIRTNYIAQSMRLETMNYSNGCLEPSSCRSVAAKGTALHGAQSGSPRLPPCIDSKPPDTHG